MEINLRNAQENKRSKRKFDWVEDKTFSNDLEAQMSINKSFINTITKSTDLLLIYLQLFCLANCQDICQISHKKSIYFTETSNKILSKNFSLDI